MMLDDLFDKLDDNRVSKILKMVHPNTLKNKINKI